MIVKKDAVVELCYTLTDKDGNVIDQAGKSDPMAYLHGYQNLLPKFEEQLEGKQQGDSVKFSLNPKDGYGEPRKELVIDVPRKDLEGLGDIQVGMQFQSETPQGPMIFEVKALNADTVTVDGNHPLAGIELHFEVEVQGIRDSTSEEREHGHVHGPGGHHH